MIEDEAGWMDYALCVGLDPELFFTERGDNWTMEDAKAICRACTVREECLEYALVEGIKYGIWGGLSERERRPIRRQRRRLSA